MFERTFFQHLWWDLWHVLVAWPKTKALFHICSFAAALLRGQTPSKHVCGLVAPIRCYCSGFGFPSAQQGLVPSRKDLSFLEYGLPHCLPVGVTKGQARSETCLYGVIFSQQFTVELGTYCQDDVWISSPDTHLGSTNITKQNLCRTLKKQTAVPF